MASTSAVRVMKRCWIIGLYVLYVTDLMIFGKNSGRVGSVRLVSYTFSDVTLRLVEVLTHPNKSTDKKKK